MYICKILIKRQVYWIIEQPTSSLLFDHPRMARFLARHQDIIYKAVLDMGCWSLRSPKATLLVGTAPYLPHLSRKMSSCEREAMVDSAMAIQTAKTYFDKEGKKRTSGLRALKSTQSYPVGFGAAHCLVYHNQIGAHVDRQLPGAGLCDDDDDSGEDAETIAQDPSLKDIWLKDPKFWHSNLEGEGKLRLKRG